jgi:hypothetical protein
VTQPTRYRGIPKYQMQVRFVQSNKIKSMVVH